MNQPLPEPAPITPRVLTGTYAPLHRADLKANGFTDEEIDRIIAQFAKNEAEKKQAGKSAP